ncbi:unnamed protein product [Albugo candida]|uniref:Condensin-2 complex subunit H2 n=1 Tax=Albugo candida TaxID=65357 RepID=A0A024GNA1_9STRA|nr:unnamed protein product [Albugo candida]|eukprot:CCI47985.1 unnamed protein product [Albugo candida]
MSQSTARFQHLLQPIRDLSQNWNIDLAQELEEYLEELEHLKIAFDKESEFSVSKKEESKTSFLNFAEAALVIQNTSAIYSRKVEYLYALVFQVLEYISRPQSSNVSNEPQTDKNSHPSNDTFTDPLPIVLKLAECKQISRKQVVEMEPLEEEHFQSSKSWINQPEQELRVSIRYAKMAKKRHESIENSVSLMNSFLHDDWEHGKDAFKMLSCALHPSGVLLFDETSRKYLGSDVLSREEQAEMTNFLKESTDAMEIAHETQDLSFTEVECDPVDEVDDQCIDTRHIETNVWKLLDPYDAKDAIVCPFEKGKTYVQPRNRKRKRIDQSDLEPILPTGSGQRISLQDSWSWSQSQEALMNKLQPKMGSLPLLPMKNETLWKMENAWKRWVHRRRLVNETSASMALLQAQEQNEDVLPHEPLDFQPESHEPADEFDWNTDNQNVESIDPVPVPNSSYEELCRQHITDFMKGSEQYLRESNLTKKVTSWKAKLTPCLQEQATHSPFDIHTYGSQILTQLNETPVAQSPSLTVQFDKLVGGFPPYEVCRTFLASLQLANNGNVALFHDSPLGFELQLR